MHLKAGSQGRKLNLLAGAGLIACAITVPPSSLLAQDRAGEEMVVRAHRTQNGPGGWFGVTVNDTGTLDAQGNPFYNGYPVVTSVEPGSPAEKAGVKVDDVLITFNDHDMKGSALELRNWLQPGSSFVVKLRRDGVPKQVRGIIGKRPPGFGERVTLIWTMPESGGGATGMGGPRNPAMNVRMRAPLPAKLPPVMLNSFSFGGGVYPFAGAEFTALNPDLSDALGVKKEGVFVTSVVSGSPARLAGLRGGDVVLTADSIRLDDPMALVRAIRESDDRSIRLGIVRKKKSETILLKW